MIEMDYGTFFVAVCTTITTIGVILCLYMLYVSEKRLKQRQEGYLIDYVRDRYEHYLYEKTEELAAEKNRFQDINHLLLVQPSAAAVSLTRVPNTSFFDNMNINLNKIEIKYGQIACLMPLHRKYNNLYNQLKQTCHNQDFNLVRSSDSILPTESLPKHIVKMILESMAVIAVLDGRNPNVMYEIGIAHSMGKLVIMVAGNKSTPFDINHQRLILYSSLKDLDTKLTETLKVIKGV